ncbi:MULTISPECIES: hypothetical protein [unclassified Streptomyces]|uniref:hypothetical protein n=1 Tax=unclassified Streptomyces TaxID=2593676 RepID=UPI0037FCA0C2
MAVQIGLHGQFPAVQCGVAEAGHAVPLAAVVAGLLAGLLTYAQSGNWPGSLLAALGAGGAALVSLPLLL